MENTGYFSEGEGLAVIDAREAHKCHFSLQMLIAQRMGSARGHVGL